MELRRLYTIVSILISLENQELRIMYILIDLLVENIHIKFIVLFYLIWNSPSCDFFRDNKYSNDYDTLMLAAVERTVTFLWKY